MVLPVAMRMSLRVLVVDHDYFRALDTCACLVELGAEVIGPVPSNKDALALLRSGAAPEVALLRTEIRDGNACPTAYELARRDIPFAFWPADARAGSCNCRHDAPVLSSTLLDQVVVRSLRDLATFSADRLPAGGLFTASGPPGRPEA